jgi:hypothetical protein
MTTEATYISPEELFRRLQNSLGEGVSDSVGAARRTRLGHEAASLVRALAERIYDGPQDWGFGIESELWGEDIPHDLLLAVFNRAGGVGFKTGGFDWFEKEVLRRIEVVKSMVASVKNGRKAAIKKASRSNVKVQQTESGLTVNTPSERVANPWRHFELNFPREALLLRLRFLLNRTNAEIMTILEIPSAGAVNARVRAARTGMGVYLRDAGYDPKSVDEALKMFEEDS